jgi:hypothetical protein
MKQLSLRGFDPMLEKKIREIARNQSISLNRAAICLMRKGAGFTESGKTADVVGDSLNHLIGKWSKEEANTLLKSLSPLDQIDRSFWK